MMSSNNGVDHPLIELIFYKGVDHPLIELIFYKGVDRPLNNG
jgi:hypothetical protein